MKIKHAFFIWLIADAFIAVGFLAFILASAQAPSKDFDDSGFLMLILVTGFLVSTPSLIILMFFHAFYSKKPRTHEEYVKAYTIMILVINAGYLVVTQFNQMGMEFNYFYIGSTVAGLLALFLVQRSVRKYLPLRLDEERDSGDLL